MVNEKRLISYDVLIAHLDSCIEQGKGLFKSVCVAIKCFVEQMPTVDAVEVVHGQWLYDSGSGKYFCSACDEYALSFKKDTLYGGDLYEVCLTDYCPNCGAKMDK